MKSKGGGEMKTVISYFDFMGKFKERKKSDYMNYRKDDKIIFKTCAYVVMSVLHSEDENIKIVNAYRIFKDKKS